MYFVDILQTLMLHIHMDINNIHLIYIPLLVFFQLSECVRAHEHVSVY